MTDAMVTIDTYAASQGVAVRTVRRWLDKGEVPGAVKVKGQWLFPEGAIRVESATDVVAVQARAKPPAAVQLPTMDDTLATLPAYLDLATASRLLGVTERVMKAHRDDFGLVRYGEHGAYVMPQAVIRRALG